MRLTTRLSLFFLAALALVLAGFSLALYGLARGHLQRQSDERLAAAVNTLVAAAEVAPEGVVWDRAERRLAMGGAGSGEGLVWLIRDDQGRVVDQSPENLAGEFPALQSITTAPQQRWRGQRWQFGQRHLEAPGKVPPPQARDDEPRYAGLTIAAGVSLEPMHGTLRRLAATLAGLSVGVWVIALVAGRFVCRRALRPLTAMAAKAREIKAADFQERLPAATGRDELHDLATAFNDLLDRLQDSFERQRRFSGEASHQLRTPLAAMLGQLEVALRRERPVEEYQRVLTTVHEQAQQLKRIVESLLFLARADSEAPLPDRERVDLSQWLPEHLRSWSQHGRFPDIVVDSSRAGSFHVRAHPVLLGELVNILLDNACKYSAAATRISLHLSDTADAVCLQVEDHGPGIDAADLPQLFRPFFRAAAARERNVDGVGLGLTIARRLAESQGGSLFVSSRSGEGSCFALLLPAESSLPVDRSAAT